MTGSKNNLKEGSKVTFLNTPCTIIKSSVRRYYFAPDSECGTFWKNFLHNYPNWKEIVSKIEGVGIIRDTMPVFSSINNLTTFMKEIEDMVENHEMTFFNLSGTIKAGVEGYTFFNKDEPCFWKFIHTSCIDWELIASRYHANLLYDVPYFPSVKDLLLYKNNLESLHHDLTYKIVNSFAGENGRVAGYLNGFTFVPNSIDITRFYEQLFRDLPYYKELVKQYDDKATFFQEYIPIFSRRERLTKFIDIYEILHYNKNMNNSQNLTAACTLTDVLAGPGDFYTDDRNYVATTGPCTYSPNKSTEETPSSDNYIIQVKHKNISIFN